MEYLIQSNQSIFDVSITTTGINGVLNLIQQNGLEWDDDLEPLETIIYPDTVFSQVIVPDKPQEVVPDVYLVTAYFAQTYYDIMAMNEGSFDGFVDWVQRNNLEFDQTPITGDILTCKLSLVFNNSIRNSILTRKLIFVSDGEGDATVGRSYDYSFDLSFDS